MIKIIIIIALSLVLVGCNETQIVEIHHELECKEVVYNGYAHTLEYKNELNNVNVEYENNEHTEVGEYVVTARFFNDNQVKESEATLKIEPYLYTYDDFEFTKEILYDGLTHEINFNKEIIADNVLVYFEEENSYKEIGSYTNTLVIESENINIVSTKIKVDINIVSSIEIDEVYNSEFNDEEFTYNTDYQTKYLNNHNQLIDYGFEIEYINNNQINVGEYDVVAKIYKQDILIHNVVSTFKINHKILIPKVLSHDEIRESDFYEFNIEEIEIDAKIEIKYFNTSDLDVRIGRPLQYGRYLYKVEYSNYDSNYIIKNIEYVYQINLNNYDQTLINNSKLIDETFTYDGEAKQLQISNQTNLRFERYTITYTYNNEFELPVEIGEYEVVATIYKNNQIVKQLKANLIIN